MQVGEIVTLGRHRLMCGDSFNPEHVDALMQGEKPDMLYCDPPYGIGKHDPDRRTYRVVRGKSGDRYVFAAAGKTVRGDGDDLPLGRLATDFSATREQFWWGADYYAEHLPRRNDGCFLVWDKRVNASLDAGLGSCFELCWSKARHKREFARIPWSGFIGIRDEPDRRRHHPTQKPVALAEWFLSRYSKEDHLIVDLFAGSGSTLLACERMDRRCYAMEIDPSYCQVIIDRYERMTQQSSLDLTA